MKSLLAPFFSRKRMHKKSSSVRRLSRVKKPELAAFFFFLIPGIPNGIVPYVFAETDIPLPRYIAAVAAGSAPSTFICTYFGSSVSKGDYTAAIVVFAVAVAAVLLALLFKNRIFRKPRADAG